MFDGFVVDVKFMTAMLQETGPDFVIGTMEEFLTGSKYCDLAFICDDNLVCDMT